MKNNFDNSYTDIGFSYSGGKLKVITDVLRCGTNYHTDLGFTQRIENNFVINNQDTSFRLGWYHLYNNIEYNFFTPKNKYINIITSSVEAYTVWNLNGSLNETNITPAVSANLKNSGEANASITYTNVHLLHAIRFFGETVKPLPMANYAYTSAKLSYNSDVRKRLGYRISGQYGGFYNGNLLQVTANINYRIQPWGNFALNIEQNNIKLPDEYGQDNFTLLGVRADISFSKNILWANYVQYNKQRSVFLINSRLQWRYKPMSDMFLVYTDNYLASDFVAKYRAVVFKINYWW